MVTDIANWHCCLCVVNTWYGMLVSTSLILVIHRLLHVCHLPVKQLQVWSLPKPAAVAMSWWWSSDNNNWDWACSAWCGGGPLGQNSWAWSVGVSELSHLQWPQQGQEAGPGIGMGVDPGRAANSKGWSSQDNNMDTQGPGKGMGVDLGTATGPIGKSSKDTKGASKGTCVDMGPDVVSSKGKHRDGKDGAARPMRRLPITTSARGKHKSPSRRNNTMFLGAIFQSTGVPRN